MKRFTISFALVIFLFSLQALAQDFSKVEIKTIKVAGNIYMLMDEEHDPRTCAGVPVVVGSGHSFPGHRIFH